MRKYDPDKLLSLMNFLCWYQQDQPGAYWGGVPIETAMQGLQHVLGLDDEAFELLKQVSLGTYTPGEPKND
jgi:hypothetical protein